MEWLWLLLAGLMEIGWAVSLKYTEGFSKFIPSVLTVLVMMVSFLFLSLSLNKIPIGTAYAIWTGVGAAGVALIGMLFFGESREVGRLICIGLIILGTVGLKFLTKT